MRYISLFSGIEAATVAWEPLGWEAVAFADIDKFPSAVLKHHYPDVPNLGDVVDVNWKEYEGKADVVVGGSPCQSFSVAGKRLGMDDPRGNLALHFLRVVRDVQPTWFLFENVPGLLSSNDGEDFAAFLSGVGELGYGFAYRVLDAQYFGVAQRRRRVFVVGHSGGDWRRAAAVLFESESLFGNPAPRRSKGENSTPSSESGIGKSGEQDGPYWNGAGVSETLTRKGDDQRMPDKNRFQAVIVPDVAATLDGQGGLGKMSHQSVRNGHIVQEVADTITAKFAKGADVAVGAKGDGNLVPIAEGVDLFNQELTGDIHVPLRTAGGHGAPAVMSTLSAEDDRKWGSDQWVDTGKAIVE